MKKLSLILSIIFLISVIPASVLSVSANVYNESSIGAEFLKTVQINDPAINKTDDQLISRAEFISVIVRFFGYNSDSQSDVPFTDVKNELTGVLKYALDIGMISPAQNFRPDDSVTYNEAIKMTVVAMGYDYLAKVYGGWPVGYVKIASDINLSDNLDLSQNTINKNGFYTFIENVLTAEMLEIDGVSGDEINYKKYTTVLETYFNMYEIEGVVTANEYTGLYSDKEANDKSYISVNDYKFRYSGTQNYIGQNVRGFVYEKNDTVALIVPNENKVKFVDFSDVLSFSGNILVYESNENESKLRIDSIPAVIYNGKSDSTCKINSFIGKNGYFKFVDNDNDNVYEVCCVYERKTVVVSGVNAIEGYITDTNNEKRVDLTDDDCVYFVYRDGKEISLTDITAGMLLSCYVSRDNLYSEIYVESESMSGIVTGFNDSANIIVIDDNDYYYSDYFKKHYLPNFKTGSEISVMFSENGLIEAASESKLEGIDFGYYLDVTMSNGMDDSIKVKIANNNGEIAVHEVHRKLILDGISYNNHDAIVNLFFDSKGNKRMNEQLIRYKLTADNKLALIDTKSSTDGYLQNDASYDDNLIQYVYPSSSDDLVHDEIWISSTTGIVHPWYTVNSDTYFIQVNSNPDIDEDKRFVVRDLNWFKKNKHFSRKKTAVYNVDENLVAGAMVFDMATDDTVTDESALGIVHSVTKALTSDLIEAYKVVIFRNNYYYDYFVSDEDVINKCILNSDGSMKIANGDVIRYEYDNLNNISVIELDYDASKKELIHKNSNQMYLCYYYGGVYSIGGGTMTMIRASADGTALDIGHQRYAFSVPATVTIHDSKTGEITLGTADDLETYLQVGDECTRIMVVTDDLTMRNCIVFR